MDSWYCNDLPKARALREEHHRNGFREHTIKKLGGEARKTRRKRMHNSFPKLIIWREKSIRQMEIVMFAI